MSENDWVSPRKPPSKLLPYLAVVLVWGACVLLGLLQAWTYEMTPGGSGQTPGQFPAKTELKLPGDKSSLLVFMHPKCPCSQATLEKLQELKEKVQDKLDVQVVMYYPKEKGPAFIEDSLAKGTRKLGYAVIPDEEGTEAKRFGAQTSGHAFMFSSDKKLLFSGGLTSARGHAGPSAASENILAILSASDPSLRSAETFGCCIDTCGGKKKP